MEQVSSTYRTQTCDSYEQWTPIEEVSSTCRTQTCDSCGSWTPHQPHVRPASVWQLGIKVQALSSSSSQSQVPLASWWDLAAQLVFWLDSRDGVLGMCDRERRVQEHSEAEQAPSNSPSLTLLF